MTEGLTTKEREGYARAFLRNGGGTFDIPAPYYTQLLADWMAGKAFFHATDVWGDAVVMKLGEVWAVGLCTVDGLARFQADEQIETQRARARSMLDGQ